MNWCSVNVFFLSHQMERNTFESLRTLNSTYQQQLSTLMYKLLTWFQKRKNTKKLTALSVIVPRHYTNPRFHVHNTKGMLRGSYLKCRLKRPLPVPAFREALCKSLWTVEQRETLCISKCQISVFSVQWVSGENEAGTYTVKHHNKNNKLQH